MDGSSFSFHAPHMQHLIAAVCQHAVDEFVTLLAVSPVVAALVQLEAELDMHGAVADHEINVLALHLIQKHLVFFGLGPLFSARSDPIAAPLGRCAVLRTPIPVEASYRRVHSFFVSSSFP